MKTFKNTMLIIYTIIAISVFSQDDPEAFNLEIGIANMTGDNIEVQLHPVSCIYRMVENPYPTGNDKWYYTFTAKSRNSLTTAPYYYDYNSGTHYISNGAGYISVYKNIIDHSVFSYQGWNDDLHSERGFNPDAFGTFGYGNYKLIIKNLRTNRIDSCIIMLDYYSNNLSWGTPGDCYLYINPDNVNPRFQYRFATDYNEYIDINYDTPDGYTLRSWAPNGLGNPLNRRDKKLGPDGGFELVDLPETNNKNIFPLDSRKDCGDVIPLFQYYCNQNQVFPEPPPSGLPQVHFDERHGIIPLNLTIKKKVSTPNSQTEGYPSNLQIIVEPSVILTIDKGITTEEENIKPYGFYMNQYQNTDNGNDLVLKSSTIETQLTTLKLNSGSESNYNSRIYVHNNNKIIAESNTLINFGDYSQIFLARVSDELSQIKPKLILQNNSNVVFGANSEIDVDAYGEFVNEGGNISYVQNSNAKIIIKSNGLYEIAPNVTNTHIVNNGGKVLLQGGQLKIGDNSKLVFDGSTSYLQVDAGSSILLGANASIEFKNGAYLVQNGGTISSINSSTPGKGLYFENAGAQTSISGTTFNYLTNAIFINNTSSYYASSFKNIANNIFNYTGSSFSCNAIETKNAYNITISNNQITLPQNIGIGMLIRYSLISEEESQSTLSYLVNIQNNQIYNGVISAAFTGMASSYAVINFKYNTCSGGVSNSSLFMRQTCGIFKYNNISSGAGKSLDLSQSTPNIYNNYLSSSSSFNVYNYESYPQFAPVTNNSSDGGLIWVGGRNTFTSTGNGNIYFYDGNAILDWGENIFSKSSSYHHLWGEIDEPLPNLYYVRNNCFNGSHIPDALGLVDINSSNIVNPYYDGSTINCSNSTDAGTIWLIRDLGNGVYDTIYKTTNSQGYQSPQDEVLYSMAYQKMQLDQNFDAISYFKSLITGFPESSYTDACLYSLYSCYQKLDTSSNQGVRDILYTDIKNYLDGKILTGLYSEEFNNTAYNITIMCLASIAEYNDAMEGFEFIALYHPDAYTRLLASWDYAEVQTLLNGSGGISSKEENLTDTEYFAKQTKRVNKGINEDPIKKKVKKSFDKVKTEKTSKTEKEVLAKTNDLKSAKQVVAKMKQKDEVMSTKVTSVMRYSKTLKKEEREKMQIDDILFYNKAENKDEIKVNTNVPVVYSLSQNYPNPFNPVTKINYALPKTGLVTMKIYDVTGREIQTLENDVKQAGNYTVDFNGSLLSSGVYFYMIKSGDFVMTKRMVLIK